MGEYRDFIERLKAADSFVIASHYSPDGDGIGSTIALGMALEGMGKKVTLYNGDPVPDNLMFLHGADRVVRELPADAKFDMAVMVDCAQRKRVSKEFAEHEGFGSLACIDHHMIVNQEVDLLLVDEGAASTGEVVLRLMRKMGAEVGPDVAQLIYTTLVVDTGFFKYSSTNAHVLELASELVKLGASPWEVAKNVEENYPAARLKLLAKALATFDVDLEGRYASMHITLDMLEETGALMEHSDEFANYPRAVEGVEVSAFFREIEKDLVKVSLRSKDYVDVAALARSLGGGGHARASGLRVRGSMEEAKEKMKAAVERSLAEIG